MVWFKVDDTLAFHAKTVAAGNAAMGLWVRAGAWSSQQLTEGFIPDHIATSMGTRGEAKRLVDARLWVRVDGGYQFWQWSDDGRQPTKAKIEAEREAARKRQQAAREKAKSQRDARVTAAVTDDVTDSVSHAPVTDVVTVPPTRPDPLTTTELTLGEHRSVTYRPSAATQHPPDEPPPWPTPADARCTAHTGVADPPPCLGCKTARERAQAVVDRDRDAAEREARIAAEQAARGCNACDGTWVVDPATKLPTRRRCDHRRRTA